MTIINECRGCRSIRTFDKNTNNPRSECLYTELGTPDFVKCPCKICLIKVICSKKCYLFNTQSLRQNILDEVKKQVHPSLPLV